MEYKTKQYAHQVEADNFCSPLPFFALFMEQGTGKTKTFIDIASRMFVEGKIDAVMVIAPEGVQEQWCHEQLPQHCPVPYIAMVWRNKKTDKYAMELNDFRRAGPSHLKWLLVNVESFSHETSIAKLKGYVRSYRTFVCIDEATRIKNPSANRTINIIQGLSDISKVGKRVVAIKPLSKYRAVLTGMMVTNNPYDLWSMFEFLSPNFFNKSYYAFRARYGIERRMTVPGTFKTYYKKLNIKEIKSVRDYLDKGRDPLDVATLMKTTESDVLYIRDHPSIRAPYKNLQELKEKIAPYSFIKRKIDCLDLPPKVYQVIHVDLNDDQKTVYRDLKKNLLAEYAGRELTVLNKLTLLTRLSQVTGGFFPSTDETSERGTDTQIGTSNPKIDALLESLEECGSFPVMVLARFTAEVRLIQDAITKARDDLTVEVVYGAVSTDDRRSIVERFKKGEVDVLVATQRTIGTGYNLQAASVQYIFSNVARNTVDETVRNVLATKKNLLEFMRDKTLEEFLGDPELV
jgi:SNF2 family DNA or RNA helicase